MGKLIAKIVRLGNQTRATWCCRSSKVLALKLTTCPLKRRMASLK